MTLDRIPLAIAGLALAASLSPAGLQAAVVTRGPYLQKPTETSMVVRWRTDVATDSQVNCGAAPGSLVPCSVDGALTTEHEIEVEGLSAGTTYFYSVGTTTGELAGNDTDHHFTTNPSEGAVQPIRLWAIGDSGFADPDDCLLSPICDAPAVRDAYLAFPGAEATDLFLLLGDNAYLLGTDADFQAALFDQHQDFLRRVPAIPTVGNHEGFSSDPLTQTGPWFDMFTNPTGGEGGGEPSGTESYYSFTYGNVHVIVLDSEGGTRASMLTWLEDDLIGTSSDWIIAFWHHPPYSRGLLHNSDTEQKEIDMREDVLPVLEDYGVDLVLTGHSHSYERSYLLDGHYGLADTLAPSMILDGGDGNPAGDGTYRKLSSGNVGHEGAVYVVAGSASEVRVGTLDHPAHRIGLNELGSLVLDIDGNTLLGRFLNDAGDVTDTFQIEKGQGRSCPPAAATGCNAAGRSKLVLKKNADPLRDRLVWKWKQGDFDALELGDPTAQTDVAVCVYDDTGLLAGGGITPGGNGNPAWLPKSTGFAYKDAAAGKGGVLKMRLIPGTTRAKIAVKGKGAALGLGTLAATLPVTAQLINLDAGACWETVFATAKKNESTKVVASAP